MAVHFKLCVYRLSEDFAKIYILVAWFYSNCISFSFFLMKSILFLRYNWHWTLVSSIWHNDFIFLCMLSCFSHVWLLWPHGLCPWDSPGKNTRVGCHFLLQGIFLIQGSNLSLLCWQADSLQLSHQEKYRLLTIYVISFNYCKTSLKEGLLYLFYSLSNLGLESIKENTLVVNL